MVKGKLINEDASRILEILCQVQYGEHNVLVYPDLDSLREIYSHLCKARLGIDHNDIVLLMPHYENTASVRETLRELEVDAKKLESEGSLEIIDSLRGFFDATQNFSSLLDGLVKKAEKMGKGGVIVIADMAAFFHIEQVPELFSYEKSTPATQAGVKYAVICCYHAKDFERLSEEDEQLLCNYHYNNFLVKGL